MKGQKAGFWPVFFLFLILPSLSEAARIKDISHIDGVRENQVYGYGLVVGLNGTGDRQGSIYTIQAIGNMLRRLGINIPVSEIASQVRTRNVAAVMVTANLPPFVRPGSRIDVTVASIGDANSLSGGLLLQTPLQAGDGGVYAVAQGQILTGLNAGRRIQDKGLLNVARIPNGALIEKEVPSVIVKNSAISIILNRPDFSTAQQTIEVINKEFNSSIAAATDAGTIRVAIPSDYQGNVVGLISQIEGLSVSPDMAARVIINERTGTIVAGKDVRISTVAITHGNISVQVQSKKELTESTVLAKTYPPKGELTSNSDTVNIAGEGTTKMVVLDEGANLNELVKSLNLLGVSPKDLIAILQAIKEAGALQAELEVI